MPKMHTRLEKVLGGERWAHEYDRRSLPVLVARVERYRGFHGAQTTLGRPAMPLELLDQLIRMQACFELADQGGVE